MISSDDIRAVGPAGVDSAELLFLLWAKIGHAKSDTFANRHPLPCHCIDVGKTAALLYDRVLGACLKNRLVAAFGGNADAESIGRWMAFWAACHDLGKASPGFQSKRCDAVPPLERAGLDFTRRDDHPHQFISASVLATELARASPVRPAMDMNLARRVAIAVGGHHGLFPLTNEWHDLPIAQLGCGVMWGTARLALVDELAATFCLSECSVPRAPSGPDAHWPMMVLAGLVAVADWIGSNTSYFPHSPHTSGAAAYAVTAEQNALRALKDLGWLEWSPTTSGAKTFDELFVFSPRPLQEAAIEVAQEINGPALVLIEAPMGEGKTEAALYLAEQRTHKSGGTGLYVAMPTMATGNQMFGRVRDFLAKRYPNDTVNLQLLHSGAMLSEEFSEMQRDAERRRQGFEPSDVYDSVPGACGAGSAAVVDGAVVAQSWFANNKKQAMLAPFGVGTVDQALLSVLQVRHGFVRLFGLAGKTIIVDEVHAYDTYMSTLLGRMLEWFRALGCSVVLLSATLPPAKRQALVKAWTGCEPAVDNAAYPRLTVASGVSAKTGSFEADPARRISVGREWHDADKLAAALETALVLGGCAAVIRNTVGEAQQTFAVLRGALRPRGFDVRLFHARFLFDDRQRIEREALDCFGKGPGGLPANPKRPQKAVLVATQVIEQSLDLDFDLMVSDVAPIDLVLQRVGRLHRHDRPERPIKTPVLWLLKPNQFDEVPSFGRGNEMIYDRYILLRSFLELRTRPVLNLPGGIDEMVRAVYEGEAAGSLSPEWLKALAQSRDKLEADQLEDAQKAATAILGSPWFQDDILEDGNRDLIEDEDDPTAHALIRAATRLAEPSVRAVFAHRTAGGLSLLPDGSVPLSRSRKPSLAEARRILGRAVTLQHRGVVAQLSHRAPPSGFQASGLLRHHCLLEIDESGWVRAGPYRLVPDAELGIQIIKDDMEGGPDL